MIATDALPPGQVSGKRFVIYAALGIPKIDAGNWSLKVDGLVEHPVEYSYQQLTTGELVHYVRSFHCLLPESVVYANPEPIEMKDVVPGTMIIGRDGKRHRVRSIIKKTHSGKIVGVKASYLPPERMTPDHPVLTVLGHPGIGKSKSKRRLMTFSKGYKPEWVKADNLKVGDYVFFPKYKQISTGRYARFRKFKFVIDENLAEILGWYVAGGSSCE